MEVTCSVNLNGIAEKLQELGPKLARRALRKAVAALGDLWVGEMKSRVPVDTGGLRDSIKAKVSSRGGKNSASAKVSVGPTYDTKTAKKSGAPSQQPGVYGMFVEFGTKDAKAEPFMRPTFDATADKAVEIFANVLREDLGL